MKTQRTIYNNVYINKKKQLIIEGVGADKASRIANKFAVQNTWELYNDQYKNIR